VVVETLCRGGARNPVVVPYPVTDTSRRRRFVSAVRNCCAHGHRLGPRRTSLPEIFTRRAAIEMNLVLIVCETVSVPGFVILPRIALHLIRLCASAAHASQTPLAEKFPDGRCSNAESLMSLMQSSITARFLWNWSASTVVPPKSVRNPKYRQLGQSSACFPISLVRLITSLRFW